MFIKKIVCFISVLIIGVSVTGCGSDVAKGKDSVDIKKQNDNYSATKEIFAMDTYMTLTATGKDADAALEEAVSEIEELDQLFSVGNDESEVSIVNKNGSEILSDDTAYLIDYSLRLYESTKGAFDISVYPLMEAWGFTTGKYKVPAKDTIQKLLLNVDSSQIEYNSAKKLISLPNNLQIDLGGIAKGYTSSKVMDIYQKHKLVSGMVSLGGNVQLYGSKSDGSKWKVAIEDPTDTSQYLGVIQTDGKAVITSGGYERYFEENGKKYHHILNPKTGYPANNGLSSVTIISEDGTLADGLSTSLFVMGKEEAISYWKEYSQKFEMVLVDEEGNISISEGIEGDFSPEKKQDVFVIRKEEDYEK